MSQPDERGVCELVCCFLDEQDIQTDEKNMSVIGHYYQDSLEDELYLVQVFGAGEGIYAVYPSTEEVLKLRRRKKSKKNRF